MIPSPANATHATPEHLDQARHEGWLARTSGEVINANPYEFASIGSPTGSIGLYRAWNQGWFAADRFMSE